MRNTSGFALLAFALAACGSSNGPADGGTFQPPLFFDAGVRPDAGTPADAGTVDRAAECGGYCGKLFACQYFPRPESPPGYSVATCTQQCATIAGFPPQERRDCVRTSQCTCDGGTSPCHTADSCFASFTDGGI